MNYRKLILDRLLDKYEKSRSFSDENSRRRIMLKMGSRDFPEYDIEQPTVRETFNSTVAELAARGLVGFEWLKHEQGNIIDRVWLIIPNVEKAYLEISRKAKRSVLDSILQKASELAEMIGAGGNCPALKAGGDVAGGVLPASGAGPAATGAALPALCENLTPTGYTLPILGLSSTLTGDALSASGESPAATSAALTESGESTVSAGTAKSMAEPETAGSDHDGQSNADFPESWQKRFLDDVIASIKSKSSTAGLLPDDEEQALAILKAVGEIHRLGGKECLERVFSLQCYGDSKYFERKVKGRIAGILKKYCTGAEESGEMPEDDILAQAGILQSPEYVEFRGGIAGRLEGKIIDFSSFLSGVSINADTVRGLDIEDMGHVKKIMFIENKANYVDFAARNRDAGLMAVYLGGFYSPVKGIFIKKLHEKAKAGGVEFFLWSDVDVGGFLIFNKLRTNIIPELKPYMMDRAALESMLEYAVPIDGRYAAGLEKLLEDSRFEIFHDVIRLMLEKRVRLEQEAFLLLARGYNEFCI